MSLSLPPLVEPSTIERQNVLATGVIYAAYQLEQLQFFRVTDRIVEKWQQGMLPVGRTTGNLLTKYTNAGPSRSSHGERRGLYVRALGLGGDGQQPEGNRDFNRLWMRFVSAAAAYDGARSRQPDIRKRGRDLALNLSLHGYGMGYFAATELRDHLVAAQRLLSSSEMRAAFGARDMWHVIATVSGNELGGTANVARYRTLAATGLDIVRWLSEQGKTGRRSGSRAGLPTQAVANACEAWLVAAASTDDEENEKGGGTWPPPSVIPA